MRTKCLFILLCLLELSNHQELLAQESSDSVAFSGQLVSWAGINFSDPGMQHLGIRYLPSFSYEHKTKQGLKLDFEASANAIFVSGDLNLIPFSQISNPSDYQDGSVPISGK